LADLAAQFGIEPKVFTPDAMAALKRYEWPGNVRELYNCIEGLTLTVRKTVIDTTALPVEMKGGALDAVRDSESLSLEDAERTLIHQALEFHSTIRDAASALGIGERTVYAKMKKYGISARSRSTRIGLADASR
jgi:DNA-binding NtrC family response regulator